jgi:hypothetical protein
MVGGKMKVVGTKKRLWQIATSVFRPSAFSAEVAQVQGRHIDEIEARRRKHSLLSTLNCAMF